MSFSIFKKINFILIFFLVFSVFSGFVFAHETGDPHIDSAIKATTISELICLGTNFLSEKLMPPIAVILILWAGILYMTAAGRAENISKAQNTLLATVIGVVVLLIAPALVALVVSLAGGSVSESDICSIKNATTTVTDVLVNLINWLAWFVVIVSIVSGMYSGFLYMTSKGEPDKAKKATSVFVFTLIGLAVSILAFSIISIIELFIGV